VDVRGSYEQISFPVTFRIRLRSAKFLKEQCSFVRQEAFGVFLMCSISSRISRILSAENQPKIIRTFECNW